MVPHSHDPLHTANAVVTFRPASADDLPAIVALRNRLNVLELAGSPHAPIQRLSLEEYTALWGPTLTRADHCWRIAEAAGQAVGFGLIYLIPHSRPVGAFIHWAYLEPEYRRQGWGQALFDHLVDWACQQGATRIELQFIEGNEAAQRFWTKMGLRTYARKCVYYLDAAE
jgi:ribosomal protein S18 acetylase RimI-like enzyme